MYGPATLLVINTDRQIKTTQLLKIIQFFQQVVQVLLGAIKIEKNRIVTPTTLILM